ncbi:VOC family protein [Actinomadura algeriensis]|uniref:Glyoxalase superfamily protein PhnB n=1 Tax=Actinomadura algeriensis TaxID=1679523 RepID=A0ABR9JRH7_9ACTN|nr:VOC family protein [Actinomadura algeriensis]MBE1533186.1 putative glyoxalase superfamily protein PhnB [Actinomadura algeriensis]
MTLSLDIISLGAPQVEAARAFYASAFSTTATGDDRTADLDLHGTGRLALHQIDALAGDAGTDPATTGFRGHVLSAIVRRPAEVKALLDAATAGGATVVKPAKKALFGEFTAVFRGPDGAVWKLAAATKKDTAPVADPPRPTETAVYLGVIEPTASKAFYEKLGMNVEHDYGDKFIDFAVTGGASRLGLLTRKALAKDVGVDEHGDGFSALVLTHSAASRDEVDALLAAAHSAGGRITAPAARTDRGAYAGRFTDPDGHHWQITTRP